MIEVYVFIAICIFILLSSFRKIKDNERVAIYRLGKFLKIDGPGTIIILPVIDKIEKIKLDEKAPGWRGLSKKEITENLMQEMGTKN